MYVCVCVYRYVRVCVCACVGMCVGGCVYVVCIILCWCVLLQVCVFMHSCGRMCVLTCIGIYEVRITAHSLCLLLHSGRSLSCFRDLLECNTTILY